MSRSTQRPSQPANESANVFSWSRCITFAQALALVPCSDVLQPTERDAVLEMVRQHRITSADFMVLDEKPGQFGYDLGNKNGGTGWHWKLRQVRNTDERLFDVLEENTNQGAGL